jgi:hypothetical protein
MSQTAKSPAPTATSSPAPVIVSAAASRCKRGRLFTVCPTPAMIMLSRSDEIERRQPNAAQGWGPIRESHGKNPAPLLWSDLSARRHDIHLCGDHPRETRATTTPLKNMDTFLAPPSCKAAHGEAVLAQPRRKVDKGALVNGSSKGLLCRVQPARAFTGTATVARRQTQEAYIP